MSRDILGLLAKKGLNTMSYIYSCETLDTTPYSAAFHNPNFYAAYVYQYGSLYCCTDTLASRESRRETRHLYRYALSTVNTGTPESRDYRLIIQPTYLK